MPGGEGTGPQGKGRKKGQGLGPCGLDNMGDQLEGSKGDETLYDKLGKLFIRRNRQGCQGNRSRENQKAR